MKNRYTSSKSVWIYSILFLVFIFYFPTHTSAQPTEINVSGCNPSINTVNGNYQLTTDPGKVCNSCNHYEKIGGGVTLYRYSSGMDEIWSAHFIGTIDCDAIVSAIQEDETDCDPTTGGTSLNGCIVNVGLPVELIQFNASALEKSIQLEWKVANEVNNAGFEILRSIDGRTFDFIDFIEGRGTAYETKTYNYQDQDVIANQRYYYRLRQVDFDDQFEYSEVVTAELKTNATNASDFFPNPTAASTSIEVFSPEASAWKVSFYDLSGKLIFKELRHLNRGSNILSFDLATIPNGLYHVQFESPSKYFFKKLSIQH
jgi:hypothetical protein